MTVKEFIKTLYPYAKACEEKTGINAIVILAQAALESGWGKYAPGNMYFGIKDIDGVNGNEQLVMTTEYSRRPNCTPKEVGLVNIKSVTPVKINGNPFFKYRGQSYFRKYETPEGSFIDHANLFIRAKVYSKALAVKSNPIKFIDELAKHYATAPDYAVILKRVYNTIQNNLAL